MNGFTKILIITLISWLPANGKLKNEMMPTNKEMNTNYPITLFLAGDVMTGRGIDQAFAISAEPELYESYVKDARTYLRLAEEVNGPIPVPVSYDYIWGDAFEFWEQYDPDIRMINLETSITTYDKPWPQKGINYRMHPANTQTLKEADIDFCALANNHILDWNIPGLIETLESLDKTDIKHAGAGLDKASSLEPAVFETAAGRILIFSYGHRSSGIPQDWAAGEDTPGINYLPELDAAQMQREISHFKNPGDIVILSIHWGGNWGYQTPASQKNFAHELIDLGLVDLIHGHSSHHPKGVEVYRNKLIIYGAGDFINDYEGISGHESYRGELSLMYFPAIDAVTGDLQSLAMVPMKMRKFQLNHASQSDAEWMLDMMDRECRKLGGSVELKNGKLYLKW